MTREAAFVHTDTDQEEVARAIQRYDFLAMPVVEQRLVGIVTVDDVIDILEQETTEDIYALWWCAIQVKTIFRLFTHRCPQARRLAVCVTLTNSVTGTIIKARGYFGKVVALAAFIPCSSALAVMWVLSLNRGDPRHEHR